MSAARLTQVSEKRDRIMKKVLISVIWGVMLYVLAAGMSGCAQPGETTAEGHRRHQRVVSIEAKDMARDTDRLLLTDEPSKLSDRRAP
jgi:hypothetical protein